MAEQFLPCPGCRGEPFVDQPHDEPRRYLECNECTFRAEDRDWQRRTPPPATRAMVKAVKHELRDFPESDLIPVPREVLAAFLAEWAEPAPPPAPEQPKPSPWSCCICGAPVRIGDDLRPYHLSVTLEIFHAAELSDEDKKTLADGLRLTD